MAIFLASISASYAVARQSSTSAATLSPKLVKWIDALYPPAALAAEVGGYVNLKVIVGSDGRVGSITVTASNSALLTPAAEEAIRQWVFQMPVVDGKPFETPAEFHVEFVPSRDGSGSGRTCIQVLGNVDTNGTPFTPGACRGPTLTVFRDTLVDICPTGCRDLPDNEPDLLAYLTNMANLRTAQNPATYVFALTGVQGRTISFADSKATFSSDCEDCSVLVWRSNAAAASVNPGPGIFLKLSPDGKSLTATCNGTECLIALEDRPPGKSILRLTKSDVTTFVIPTSNIPKPSLFGEVPSAGRVYFRVRM